MSTKQKITPPTHEEIDQAMDLLTRATQTKAWPPSPHVDRKMKAWRKQQEKNRALIAECEEAAEALFRDLLKLLTTEKQKDLLNVYSVLVLAPHLVNEHSYKLFKDFLREANKKHLKKPVAKRTRGKP